MNTTFYDIFETDYYLFQMYLKLKYVNGTMDLEDLLPILFAQDKKLLNAFVIAVEDELAEALDYNIRYEEEDNNLRNDCIVEIFCDYYGWTLSSLVCNIAHENCYVLEKLKTLC